MEPAVARLQTQAVTQQEAPTDIAQQIAEAKATLSNCQHLRSKGTEACAAAKQAIAEAKEATASLATSIESVEDVIAKTSTFDAQWEEFKRKFDDLTKMAVEKLAGVSGAGSGAKRPAEMISEQRVAQVLSRATKVVVLTGAGISAESGIPTFRGADGFWTVGSENYRPQELATWEKFNEMPEELWRWYQYRWGICTKAKPNPGHHALVELEKLVNGDFALVTQNIDGLHLQAGSDRQCLHEIHGRIDEMRCDEGVKGACLHGLNMNDAENFDKIRATIVKTPKPAEEEKDEHLPCCAVCGVRQRPKILWFDECYNEALYGSKTVDAAVRECDVLLIIGTQLSTGLPRSMVAAAKSTGATIIKMDTIVDLSDESNAGMLHLEGKSGEAMPRIIAEIQKLRQEPSLAPLADLAKVTASVRLEAKAPRATVSHLSDLQPLQGSPASSLRRNSSLARGQLNATSAQTAANITISPSVRGKPGSPPAAGRNLTNKASQSRARSNSSGALKAGASVSLLKNATGKTTSDKIDTIADGFFVYGTLRPDDDSGASWTKSFCEGMDSEVAFLPGASLYIDGSYPAVSFEQTRCSVRGAFLRPTSGKNFSGKLAEADRIESYPDLYERVVATVQTASGSPRRAYVYHRTGRTDRAESVKIHDGDWLSRKRG